MSHDKIDGLVMAHGLSQTMTRSSTFNPGCLNNCRYNSLGDISRSVNLKSSPIVSSGPDEPPDTVTTAYKESLLGIYK